MTRIEAVKQCWDFVNERKYREANKLMREQRRIHGHRFFTYWLRLSIANGVWELDIEDGV